MEQRVDRGIAVSLLTPSPLVQSLMGMPMSVAEYLELELPEPDDKRTIELDDGKLYIAEFAWVSHQFVLSQLLFRLRQYLDGFSEPPAEVWQRDILVLSRDLQRIMMADLTVTLQGHEHPIVDGCVEVEPDIVVEIISDDSRHRDLVWKRQVYAEAAIPEYWIFDWRAETVLLLELQDCVYVERANLSADDTLTTPLLPGLAIPLADVFRHRSRPAR